MDFNEMNNDYVVVRAMSDNVQIVGLTRGDGTKPQHTENLRAGEVMLLQFTQNISAIKIRGNATVYTKHGAIPCGEDSPNA